MDYRRSFSLTTLTIAALAMAAVPAQAQLELFPNSLQSVSDNGTGDLNPAVGTISVANWAVPDNTGAASPIELTGDIIANYVGPTNSVAGNASVTITNAFLTNTSAQREVIGSTPANPSDYGNMLEFAIFGHSGLTGPGTLSINLDGSLGQLSGGSLTNPPSNATTDQQFHVGLSDLAFSGTGSDFAYAHWIRPAGTATAPLPVSDSGSASGTFTSGAGRLQIHIDDALVLGAGDTIELPTSLTVQSTGSPIPEPSTALLLLTAGMIAIARRRRRA